MTTSGWIGCFQEDMGIWEIQTGIISVQMDCTFNPFQMDFSAIWVLFIDATLGKL